MYDKQEIFEAFCKYCAIPDEDSPLTGWVIDMQMEILEKNFAFYFDFFKEYMQISPGSS
ncbi:MAG: hypothetical protein FWE98_00035 [Oscillospiraceae bacterium]|nr:hypothetical protein [Oscillospiraceae bacterium]